MKAPPYKVIYEDNHLIAVEKSAGVLVQGDATGDPTLADHVKAYIKVRYNKPGDVFLGIVHRLDRPVSGVVVFARTSKALTRMNALFREQNIRKNYLAISTERPTALHGELTHFLSKDPKKNKAHVHRSARSGRKKATLSYEMIAGYAGYTLFDIQPKTGRPHQIRVQMQAMGCPIVGDLKYGYPKANQDRSICLHCRSLAFVHPVKKESITITASIPTEGPWFHFKDLF